MSRRRARSRPPRREVSRAWRGDENAEGCQRSGGLRANARRNTREARWELGTLADAPEAESCNLLLQHVIADNFDTKSDDYAKLVKSVADAVRVGGEAAAEAGRPGKVEIAERM